MNRQVFFQLKALVARDLLRQSGKQDVTVSNPMLSCKPLSVAMRWAAYNFRSSKFFFPFQIFASVFAQIQIVEYTQPKLRKRRRSVRPPRSAWKRRCAADAPPRRLRLRPRHRALGGPRCERPQRRLQSTRFEAWRRKMFSGEMTALQSDDYFLALIPPGLGEPMPMTIKKTKPDEDETPCMDFLQASYWNSLG